MDLSTEREHARGLDKAYRETSVASLSKGFDTILSRRIVEKTACNATSRIILSITRFPKRMSCPMQMFGILTLPGHMNCTIVIEALIYVSHD